ncbi:nickel ABC transporter, nickel/metallophore periplasmic binding protein [Streptomyces chartreusis NRRL 3882]|uniref:Nickel ABC transporter, nickel/metallophore periplasmic binding protein n=1 Tax=Streptomyces chartreusis NRRL 3882 TaxID=1079985 RepID=A0A2N9B563_STRCX|nr:nickel ABC transporter, nickel/metallophore periplasmic binding protein [Streptomyces chartreusis NRRL 3882]
MQRTFADGTSPRTDRPPFDDERVRQAFFLIADRKELVDGALSGAGEVGNDLFGKGYEYYADGLPQREQDLDRARALLKRAGAGKLRVTLDTSAVAAGFTEDQPHQVAAQGLRRPLPAGPVDPRQDRAGGRLRADAAPSVRRGRLPAALEKSPRTKGRRP